MNFKHPCSGLKVATVRVYFEVWCPPMLVLPQKDLHGQSLRRQPEKMLKVTCWHFIGMIEQILSFSISEVGKSHAQPPHWFTTRCVIYVVRYYLQTFVHWLYSLDSSAEFRRWCIIQQSDTQDTCQGSRHYLLLIADLKWINHLMMIFLRLENLTVFLH